MILEYQWILIFYVMIRYFKWALIAFLFFGCDEKEELSLEYRVPEELEPYVDNFFSEAEARGIILSRDNLIVEFGDIKEDFICGNCNNVSTNTRIQKVITVDNVLKCWRNEQQLEALIFHEMGHCILGRPHNDDLLPNGDPVSLMISNSISAYSPCIYSIDNNPCNKAFKREYYLDEIFDPATPAPSWAKD